VDQGLPVKHSVQAMRTIIRSALTLVVPVFPGEELKFGPQPLSSVLLYLVVSTGFCFALGLYLTRSTLLLHCAARFTDNLRDEAWEECRGHPVDDSQVHVEEAYHPKVKNVPGKRSATELLFITAHNGTVMLMAAAAWVTLSPTLALAALCSEVAYEIFDAVSIGMSRLEPETLIHHIVSPICILCSTQTDIDFRVLCHLCFCIDLSGAIIGYSKFLLRYAHVSTTAVYNRLFWMYLILRVVLPLIDTVLIVRHEVINRGGFMGLSSVMIQNQTGQLAFPKTDWTQLYFWAIAVLDAFNIYFCLVIRARARMPPHLAARWEAGCR